MSKTPIAISTGWLFEQGNGTTDGHKSHTAVCDGAELCLTHDQRRLDVYANSMMPDMEYISFHLSTSMPAHNSVKSLCEVYNPEAAVFHPDPDVTDEMIKQWLSNDLPLVVENMDMRNAGGFNPETLTEYLESWPEIGVVLDTQHAYEHDETMDYAWELVERAGDKLQELHVSGETVRQDNVNRHALLSKADNRDAILGFLDKLSTEKEVPPIVLEGHYYSPSDVKKDVSLIRDAINE